MFEILKKIFDHEFINQYLSIVDEFVLINFNHVKRLVN